jgi:hypothetical protein
MQIGAFDKHEQIFDIENALDDFKGFLCFADNAEIGAFVNFQYGFLSAKLALAVEI